MSQAVRPALTARPAVVKASEPPELVLTRLSSHSATDVNAVNTAARRQRQHRQEQQQEMRGGFGRGLLMKELQGSRQCKGAVVWVTRAAAMEGWIWIQGLGGQSSG